MPFRWLDLPNRNPGIPVKFEFWGNNENLLLFLVEVHLLQHVGCTYTEKLFTENQI